ANTARDAVARLMTLLGMSGTAFSQEIMAQLIARAIHIIVHVARYADGHRRISSIVEVGAHQGTAVELHEGFAVQPSGVAPARVVGGRFAQATGTRLFGPFGSVAPGAQS